MPWVQCTYHDYIEKTGEDSVSSRRKSKKERKKKKKEVNIVLSCAILTYFHKKAVHLEIISIVEEDLGRY